MTDTKPLTREELELPLWDKELCARYLRVKYRQFSERVRYESTFPAPAATLGRKVLWRSADVRMVFEGMEEAA